ncbi:hypothetical protein N9M16_07925 [Candidatus Dependentiae bacterium]|nr:hypothetical protein [Candidatus Dependentiae bacterium]
MASVASDIFRGDSPRAAWATAPRRTTRALALRRGANPATREAGMTAEDVMEAMLLVPGGQRRRENSR